MESASKTNYGKLIEMMDAFVSGKNRTEDFVNTMESEFSACGLDENEKFSDLQYALAMFGAADRIYDEKMLTNECKYALRIISEDL